MKLKNKIKKILFTLTLIFGMVGFSSFLLFSLFDSKPYLLSSEVNSNNSKVITEGWQSNTNVVTGPINVIDQNLGSNNKYNFENLPLQNYVADFTDSGFAIFTSSNGQNGNFDQIIKFATKPQLRDFNQLDIINPGNIQWIINKSDFANILGVQASEIELVSMLYSPGGFGAHPSVFVLANCSNVDPALVGSYVFRIMWSAASGTIDGEIMPPSPGDYKLFNKISDNTNYFNFLSLESPSTNTIQALRAPKLLDINADLNITFITISEATSLTPSVIPTPIFTYTIPFSLFAGNISLNAAAHYSFRLNSDIYLFYQNSTSLLSDAATSGTWIRLIPISNNNSLTLTQENILPLNLESFYTLGIFQNNTTDPLVYELININADNYKFLISQSVGAGNANNLSNFVSISFSLSTLFANNLTSIAEVHTTPGTNIYFKKVVKLYGGANDANVVAYFALDNLDRVIKFDPKFLNPEVIYNFKQASIDLGPIPFIFTKPGDPNWYALMRDGKFAQFLGKNSIGRWDAISASSSLELAVNFDILNSNEIKPLVLYQQIANNSDNGYATEFTQYLQSSRSYNDFMNITFVDPRLGSSLPEISISASAFVSNPSRIYSIQLSFIQRLRSLNPDGSIDSNGTTVDYVLFTNQYEFINAEGIVYGAIGSTSSNNIVPPTEFSAPIFIKDKYPSEITEDEVRDFLIRYLNVPDFIISRTPSDLYGILDIVISVPVMWKSNGAGSYFIVQSEILTFSFGTQQQPFFKRDPLFGQNTSIKIVDENYGSTDPTLIDELSLKYSATLPSSVTATNVLTDFIILGTAFYNQSLINNGLIVLPTTNDVLLMPLDIDGQILVKITFPKIGNILNKELLFYTPKVFHTNPTANESIYFVFKNNDEVLNTNFGNTTNKLSSYLPSKLAEYLNGYNNPIVVQTILSYFSIYSSYFNNLIDKVSLGENGIKINAIPNDIAGTLDIQIELSTTLPNSNIYKFERIFFGFTKSGTIPANVATFSFNNIPNNLLQFSPSEITIQKLENDNIFIMNDVARSLQMNINLEPINTSGILGIRVTFYNWNEIINNVNVITPIKEFSRYFSGFRIGKEETSVIIFKSFEEIDPKYKEAFPTFVVNSIQSNEPTNLGQLLQFAHVSDSIKSYIQANDSKLSLKYIPNDSNGTISVISTLSGYLNPADISIFESKLSGFNYIFNTIPVRFEDVNSTKVQLLRSKLPQDITDEEISTLYSISYLENAPTVTTIIDPVRNSLNGTLAINIYFKNPTLAADSQPLQITNFTYSGFSTAIIPKTNVNYLVVALSVIIPIIVLVPPIIFISYFKNRKEIKRVANLLDKRLTDIEKKDSKKTTKK